MTRREEMLDAWWAHCEQEYRLAEEATNGTFLRRDREHEFGRLYGYRAVKRIMFEGGRAVVAYYFASEELVRYWEYHPRVTWAEFSLAAGDRSRSNRIAAAKAAINRQAAHHRAAAQIGGRR